MISRLRQTACWVGICLAGGFALHGCASGSAIRDMKAATTTYEKHLARAVEGNADSQNLLGFMHYFGDGVERNIEAALIWFARAAEQGHPDAVVSLARALEQMGNESDPTDASGGTVGEAESGGATHAAPRRTMAPGEETYATFCAGCHGLNGIAAYGDSPSFALGDRMDSIDLILRRSIIEGIGAMPGWGDMFSTDELSNLVDFIRTLPEQYRQGVNLTVRDKPARYFLFNAMRDNDRALKRYPSATATVPEVRKSTNSSDDN